MQNESPAQLQHKLCKKVAQLMKVIFYLNTKNDDYESNLRAVVNAYEAQLDSIVRDANSILSKAKDNDHTAKLLLLDQQFKKYQQTIAQEKQRSVLEFSAYKRAMDDNAAKMQSDMARRVREYEGQIEGLRGRVDAFARSIDALTAKIDAEKKTYDKTIAQISRDNNDKINALTKKNNTLEEDVVGKKNKITQLQRTMQEIKKQLEQENRRHKLSSQGTLSELKQSYQNRIKELSEQLQKSNQKNNILDISLKECKDKIKTIIYELEELKRTHSVAVSEYTTTIGNLNDELMRKSKQCGDATETNAIQKKTIQQLQRTIEQLTIQLTTLQRQSSLKNGQFEGMRGMYERQLQEKQAEIGILKEKLNGCMKKLQTLGLELAGLRDANEKNNYEKIKQIQRLNSKIQQLQQRIHSLQHNSTDQMKELQQFIKNMQQKHTAQLTALREQHKRDIQKQQQQHNIQLLRQKTLKQQSLLSMENTHKNIVTQIRAQHSEQIVKLNQQIHVLENRLRAQILKMQDANGYLKKMYEQQIIELKRQVNSKDTLITQLQSKIKTHLKDISLLTQENALLLRQKVSLKEEITLLKQQLQSLNKNKESLHADLLSELERMRKQLTEQQYSYEERMRLMKKDHQAECMVREKTLKDKHNEENIRMKALHMEEIEKLRSKLEGRISELQKMMRERSQLSDKEWLQNIRILKEQCEERCKSMELNCQRRVKELSQKHNKMQADMMNEYESKMNDMKNSHKGEIQRLNRAHQQRVKQMINKNEQKIRHIQLLKQEQILKIRNEGQMALSVMMKSVEQEKESHRQTKEKYQTLQKSFGIMTFEVEQERTAHCKTKACLEERESNIRELENRIKVMREGHVEELLKMKSEYGYREEEIKRGNQKKINGIVQEQIQWTTTVKCQFGALLEDNKIRISMMEEEYRELKMLFDDRPSREDDMMLIQKLQKNLEIREEEVKKIWEELKFYKLELTNRENNFNKMFNANPNVGVLNPLDAKTKFFSKDKESSGILPSVGTTKKSIK